MQVDQPLSYLPLLRDASGTGGVLPLLAEQMWAVRAKELWVKALKNRCNFRGEIIKLITLKLLRKNNIFSS